MNNEKQTTIGVSGAGLLERITSADLSLCNSAASFLQSGIWGSFKARFGWNARGFLADWGSLGQTPIMLIRRRLAPGVSFAYIPWGPELPDGFPLDDATRVRALVDIADALRPLLPKSTAFLRYDPPWFCENNHTSSRIWKNLYRAGADIQPPDTVLVDLTGSPDEIFARMKSKWRYNIRLAAKKGVTVRRADESGIGVFYDLLKATAKRDGIALHGIEYYETLFSHCKEFFKYTENDAAGNGVVQEGGTLNNAPDTLPSAPRALKKIELALYLAEHEGDVLAGIVALFRGTDAVYLYGASSDIKRNLMATYLLQWTAMQDAKERGCTVYDLFGIPPDEDPKHPMAGLYRFKTGFGGKIVHRPGSWDYGYKPIVWALFTLAEAARKGLRSVKKAIKTRNRERTGDA